MVDRLKKSVDEKVRHCGARTRWWSVGSANLRPDLVSRTKSDGRVFVVDVTIPFVNRLAAFEAAAAVRRERCARDWLPSWVATAERRFRSLSGPWYLRWPGNDEFLSRLCSKIIHKKICLNCLINVYEHTVTYINSYIYNYK